MKLGLFLLTAFIVILIIAGTSLATDPQWPTFHGDPARTGYSTSVAPSKPNILWQVTVTELRLFGVDEFEANLPIIYNDKVFFTSSDVFSADLQTGEILWHYGDRTRAFYPKGLTAGDGKIFVTVNDNSLMAYMITGFIYALSEDGQFLWKYQTDKKITHSLPLYADGKVFTGDDSGYLYAIDAVTGSLVWKKYLDGAEVIHSSPAFYDGMIFVGTEGEAGLGRTSLKDYSYLYALDAKTGEVKWKYQVDFLFNKLNLIHSTPAILDGVVYIGSENGYFYALSAKDGSLIWKKVIASGTKNLIGTSAAAGLGYGKIFISVWDGNFLALDQKSGEILWSYNYGEGDSDSSPVVADGKVCVGREYFYCFDESTGNLIWKEKLGGSSAAIASGILIVPTNLAGDQTFGDVPVLIAYSEKTETSVVQETTEETTTIQTQEGNVISTTIEEVMGESIVSESDLYLPFIALITVAVLMFGVYWFFKRKP